MLRGVLLVSASAMAFCSLKFMPVQVPDTLAFGGMALVGLCGSLGTWLAGRQIAPAARASDYPGA